MHDLTADQREILTAIWDSVDHEWWGPQVDDFHAAHMEKVAVTESLMIPTLVTQEAGPKDVVRLRFKADGFFYLDDERRARAAVGASAVIAAMKRLYPVEKTNRIVVKKFAKECGLTPEAACRTLTLLGHFGVSVSKNLEAGPDSDASFIILGSQVAKATTFDDAYEAKKREHIRGLEFRGRVVKGDFVWAEMKPRTAPPVVKKDPVDQTANPRMGEKGFFEKGSPFVSVPIGLPDTQRVWFDAVRGSCKIASAAYDRLSKALERWTDHGLGSDPDEMDLVVADAWTFVDAANRLQILLDTLSKYFPVHPGDKAVNQPGSVNLIDDFKYARKAYSTEFRTVRDLRDSVQHLDERLDKLAADKQPVWGNLTWAALTTETPPKIHYLSTIPGPLFSGVSTPAIDLHKPLKEVAGRIRLVAFGFDVDLTKIRKAMDAPIRILEKMFAPQFKGMPTAGAGVVTRMVAEIVTPGSEPPTGSAAGT